MPIDIDSIPSFFVGNLDNASIIPLTLGHINRTYKVMIDGNPAFILQQINKKVFKNIEALMDNTSLVLQALETSMAGRSDGLMVPRLVCTTDDNTFFKDEDGCFWRMFTYINGSRTIETLKKYSDAFEGGRAYGLFLDGVSSIKTEQLNIIIPDFHSLSIRLQALKNAIDLDLIHRRDEARTEIEFALNLIDSMMIIPILIANGVIPIRIVHNDTKFNNLIFSNQGKALAVIDLDTVMPGSALFDFGDAIRTAANTAREDEANLNNVKFDISIFEAFAAGYIESTEHLLNQTEIDHFPESALFMTYIIGIRFLTDFLNGDTYFHIRYPNHNLIRAKVQFELLRKMQQQMPEMRRVISRITARLIAIKS
ncbi:MAG: aminoglycoside phosphotransferase family protein [Lentimicrobium sp.]|nr:aminoglycoside phosphotransferase family protein [Lentimicrobium sp.]